MMPMKALEEVIWAFATIISAQ